MVYGLGFKVYGLKGLRKADRVYSRVTRGCGF